MSDKKIDVYQICACGSGKKIKWCHPKGIVSKELEDDLILGENLVKEFDEKQKHYSPFEDSQEYHESFH